MISIRHLQYLTVLMRERHFARAAAACNVTQPTLSAAIRQIEAALGVVLVERNNRFIAVSAKGRIVDAWAQRALADIEAMTLELSAMRRGQHRRPRTEPGRESRQQSNA